MGAGDFNGHNHGGLHTGMGKGGKRGPYSADGFRPNTQISHLDFLEDDKVHYIGFPKHNVTRGSYRILENGSVGHVMVREEYNSLQKVPRSKIQVDFGEKGIRYVDKKLLQHTDDFELYIDELLDKGSLIDGFQSFRVECRKEEGSKATKAKKAREEEILVKRAEKKKFLEKKKLFRYTCKLEMEAEIASSATTGPEHRRIGRVILMLQDDAKKMVVDSDEYVKIRQQIRDLNKEQHNLKEHKEKLEYMYSQGMFVKDAHSPSTYYQKVQEFMGH